MNNICAIIPARYASSRLNKKLLLKINGKSIISLTYLQAKKSQYIDRVFVATDNAEILNALLIETTINENDIFLITTPCINGTERICKCLPHLDKKYDIIVNIQGDEPFINPTEIDFMIERHLAEGQNLEDIVCSTLHTTITNSKYLNDPSFGKMVVDTKNNVLYASRTAIPTTKSGEINPKITYLTHIGIFVFKRQFLEEFVKYPNTPLQLSEDIEWLKILEIGYRIKSYLYEGEHEIGINTIEDYNHLISKYSNQEKISS